MEGARKRAEEYRPVSITLPDKQKKQILKYMEETGLQVGLGLEIQVVEGKISPAAENVVQGEV